ncbi:MAG: FecR domain-containing protein [Bauldia sp.]|nr:FecR domain-containing protein [Bauldia sp.]MCW5718704.1 FecR domain-containing protein [Bauldia sp.]
MIGKRFAAAFVVGLAGLLAPGLAAAQAPIATAVQVIPATRSELGGAAVTILTGAELFVGQRIETDINGEVQIIFADQTRMVIGPNSALIIETYLMQNPTTLGEFTVNALGGSFRFITGNGPSDAYRINTPTGAITVRGTEFDFIIDWLTGALQVFLFEGSVILCPTEGPCVTISDECQAGEMARTDLAAVIEGATDLLDILGAFPMVFDQAGFLAAFQLTTADRCVDEIRDAARELTRPRPISPA